jgi:chemotaxis family two-component system sensor kinase Cph1
MTEQATSAALDLTNCDREPIHIPGAIQPHGALLNLRAADVTIAQASANLADHVGVRPSEALGRPLSSVIDDPTAAARVAEALAGGSLDDISPLRLVVRGRSFDGIIHRHDGANILEIEPRPQGESDGARGDGARDPLRRALRAIQSAARLDELCEAVVDQVGAITGFERVMLYRFDEQGHGSVDAERVAPGLDPYLGLRYPASDIPRPARELYLRNWLRIIPDARYAPVPLVPSLRPDTGAPLDLTFAVLRSVSPIHLEYLANMGIRAAMSISLIVRGRLWGLVSCANHSGPRMVGYELRSACEVIGRLTSLLIAALDDRDAAALRSARHATRQALVTAMRDGADVLQAVLSRPGELLSLVGAHGAAVVQHGDVVTTGATPPPERIAELARWLAEQPSAATFSTASLTEHFPAAADLVDVASGLLTFALPSTSPRRLLWFRPEIIQTVTWGGDPNKAVMVDPGMRLHPRRSFELWKQEVRLRSQPWTDGDLEMADDLRRSAIEIDLERQVEREQRAVHARDDLVAVVSHDLKNPLGIIKIAAAALLKQRSLAADVTPLERVRAIADRIDRAADRMNTLIRDLLDLAKIEAGRFAVQPQPVPAGDLVEEALALMRPLADAKRITLRGEVVGNPCVCADRERLFQVFSNVIGNAVKFTPEGGSIVIRARAHDGHVLFTVADTGPGVARDQLPHIFDRYWQARAKGREGSGLGLYIAKGIVEAHAGQIWVEVPSTGGTELSFTLPIPVAACVDGTS